MVNNCHKNDLEFYVESDHLMWQIRSISVEEKAPFQYS